MTMSALPPSQISAMRETLGHDAGETAHVPLQAVNAKWEAIHALGAQIAVMADIAPEKSDDILAAFPALLDGANAWQYDIAARGVEDAEVLLRLGLTALATVTARGQDPSAPALALWREFHHAREFVLSTLQPHAEAA
jgi:hypothetical protein